MSNTTALENCIRRMDIIARSARLGAEIKNLKLAGDMPDEVIRAIKHALVEHKVLFLRGQNYLAAAERERFAVRLGMLVAHPSVSAIKESSYGGGHVDQRNTDLAFADEGPKLSLLRGVAIPEFGGGTIWSNTASAYLDLPAPLQKLADDLWAVYSEPCNEAKKSRATEADRDHFDGGLTATTRATKHPVVRVHPQTGQRSLVLGNGVQHFVGLQKATSQRLLDIFLSYVTSPENTVRWSWKAGDVAIWDNRATQHYTANDYGNAHRGVRRAAKEGIAPLSADECCSEKPIRTSRLRTPKAA
ncbi:TauD/TfdA family dioxygenase [Bradyrhizobium sp. BWC-3-1]|uniref:TauD/TfdA dioxygenase family protein n=1 Tax=Bradyrhizobium sp. BWC-3-1 TaxID=3080012 RepID=UPI00293F7576|nr:TauD/TfdA family dioxygenase [Bradyrhizobium sp. BWC-3-1]WOH57714.1 TauD/TfdA family dioxygenase [Bradyrhizobium sp. BWC-3-1]